MNPNEEEESEGGGAGWLVSFADLMTLLFAAFVVLYGTIVRGTSDAQIGITSTIRESFVEISDDIPQRLETGKPATGRFHFRARYGNVTPKNGIKVAEDKEDVRVEFDLGKKRIKAFVDELSQEAGKDKALRESFKIEEGDGLLRLELMGAYFYPDGGYKLKGEAKRRFLNLAKILGRIQKPLLIEGHTDGPPKGQVYSASDMSAMRAGYAAKLMIEEAKLHSEDITTISFGADRPIGDPNTVKGRQQNRRIEIKVFLR